MLFLRFQFFARRDRRQTSLFYAFINKPNESEDFSAVKERKCPTCAKKITYTASNPFRPFCSERCKLIDLGAWADEKYSVAGEKVEIPMPDYNDDSSSQDDGPPFMH
jgi:uncharacterized protein